MCRLIALVVWRPRAQQALGHVPALGWQVRPWWPGVFPLDQRPTGGWEWACMCTDMCRVSGRMVGKGLKPRMSVSPCMCMCSCLAERHVQRPPSHPTQRNATGVVAALLWSYARQAALRCVRAASSHLWFGGLGLSRHWGTCQHLAGRCARGGLVCSP